MTAAQQSKPMTKNQRQQQSKSSQRLLLLLLCFCLRFYFIFCFCHFSGAKELGSNTKLLGLGQALLRTHINILNVSFLFAFLCLFFDLFTEFIVRCSFCCNCCFFFCCFCWCCSGYILLMIRFHFAVSRKWSAVGSLAEIKCSDKIMARAQWPDKANPLSIVRNRSFKLLTKICPPLITVNKRSI